MKEIDSTARALLRVVATAAAAEGSVTFDEAGRQLGRGAEELLLATRRINEASAGAGRPAGARPRRVGQRRVEHRPRPYVLAEGLAPLLAPHL